MIVNVEFLSNEPIENVVTSMHYRLDRVIYFGYGDVMEKQRGSLTKFLKKYCKVKEVSFIELPKRNLETTMSVMRSVLKAELQEGNQLFFDITGGDSVTMVAWGMISQEFHASMHCYDIEEDTLVECQTPENFGDKSTRIQKLSTTAKKQNIHLDLAGYIEMQGGVINYELHKSIKNIDTPEFEQDVVAAWKIVKNYASSWNSLSALLRSRLFDEDGNVIHCARGRVQKELRNLNNELQNEATLQKIFLALKDAGFVTEYTCNNMEYRLKFKNQASKELIWDGGSVLELYTYLLQMRNSDDCKVGIHLDWDGVIQPEGVTDLLNEVDVLSIKGNIPTFISCKSGRMNSQTSLHALYELETVAQRFGGRYAKKVLALMNPMSPIYEERAREMGIEVWMMGGNKTLDYYENHAESFVEGTDKVEFSSIQDKFLSYMERLRTVNGKEKNAWSDDPNGLSQDVPLRILDFGCGSGRDTKYFLERGYEVDACDGSEHICAIASEKTGIAVKQMLFSELHVKAKYDGIWACSSILHLPKDELAEVFWRMVQAVKPGGFLYVSFKYGTYEGERNGRYFTDFTEENFRDFLEKDVRIKELFLEELWVTNDVRPKRQDEKWLNAILRRGC